MIKFNKKRNAFLTAIAVAALYFVFYNATRLAMQESFEVLEPLVGSAVFFAVYFIMQSYINKKVEKKKK